MTSKTKTTTPPANVEKAPSVPAPATPIVTIEARELLAVCKSLTPFASADWTLPMLNVLHLSQVGETARWKATDRFVAVITHCPAVWHGTAELRLPLALVKKVAATWRGQARSTSWPLTISAATDQAGRRVVSICDPSGESVSSPVDPKGDFPDVEKLINGTEYLDGDPVDYSISFNFEYLAKFKALSRHGEHVNITWPKEPGRPALITVSDHTVGIIMPVRPEQKHTVAEILSGGAA